MNEVIKEVINYGFNEMKLHSIEANINPENKSSAKLLEKNNFVLLGTVDDPEDGEVWEWEYKK